MWAARPKKSWQEFRHKRIPLVSTATFLELREDVIHARGRRIGVARWIVWSGRDIDGLDDAIVDDHGETLAAHGAEHGHRTRVVELHTEHTSELSPCVGHKTDHGARSALVLGPARHHGTVVDAEDNNISDTLGLQRLLLRQVARDLLRGSGRRERARQANQDALLALEDVYKRYLCRREVLVQGGVRWEGVADLHDNHLVDRVKTRTSWRAYTKRKAQAR